LVKTEKSTNWEKDRIASEKIRLFEEKIVLLDKNSD
jgi:hypothetical protein